jgi:hypothetical protein
MAAAGNRRGARSEGSAMTELVNLLNVESALRMPLMQLPVRTTAVLLGQAVVLLSPAPAADLATCARLGTVTDIVAPTLFHHLGVQRAMQTFPQARCWGVPGFKAKRPDIAWSDELAPANWPYQAQLPVISLAGMPKVNERVFVHHASKSLLVCDLCFNLVAAHGVGARIILGLFGTYRRFAVSRLSVRLIADKTAFRRSLGEVFSYEFDNIVMSHGEIVYGDGRRRLLDALKERDLSPL